MKLYAGSRRRMEMSAALPRCKRQDRRVPISSAIGTCGTEHLVEPDVTIPFISGNAGGEGGQRSDRRIRLSADDGILHAWKVGADHGGMCPSQLAQPALISLALVVQQAALQLFEARYDGC